MWLFWIVPWPLDPEQDTLPLGLYPLTLLLWQNSSSKESYYKTALLKDLWLISGNPRANHRVSPIGVPCRAQMYSWTYKLICMRAGDVNTCTSSMESTHTPCNFWTELLPQWTLKLHRATISFNFLTKGGWGVLFCFANPLQSKQRSWSSWEIFFLLNLYDSKWTPIIGSCCLWDANWQEGRPPSFSPQLRANPISPLAREQHLITSRLCLLGDLTSWVQRHWSVLACRFKAIALIFSISRPHPFSLILHSSHKSSMILHDNI